MAPASPEPPESGPRGSSGAVGILMLSIVILFLLTAVFWEVRR